MTFLPLWAISKPMFFLVFEGLDGSGKSSLMSMLSDHLKNAGSEVLCTREPGGTPLGDQIRSLILSHAGENAPVARAELLLYEAGRAQHVEKIIRPALTNKKWVLCDRFSASSVAFQGGGREISFHEVEWLNHFATYSLKPHLTVLLDLPVEVSRKRRSQRSGHTGEIEDRIESENDLFHERVRTSFLSQAKSAPAEWLVLNAEDSREGLFAALVTELRKRKWIS